MIHNLAEHILSRKTVYHGGIINVEKQKVQIPTGETAERDVVHNAPAVSAVVIDKNGNMVLEKQWREAVRQVTLETPAGKVDKRDVNTKNPEDHAIERELNEELRISLGKNSTIVRLPTFFSSPGFSDERDTMYLVKNYHEATTKLPRDKGEYLHLYHVPQKRVLSILNDRKHIIDGKTLIAMLYYLIKITCKKSPDFSRGDELHVRHL